jgi:hypothetical protein
MTREHTVVVTVDEEFSTAIGKSTLHIKAVDCEKGFESNILADRGATPESISGTFESNATFLEEEPPKDLRRNPHKLKAKIDFYKTSAQNVPGLKKH